MGNCHPLKPMSTSALPWATLVFTGWQFPMLIISRAVNIYIMLPSSADSIYYISLNVSWVHCLHYIWFQNNPGQVNIWAGILYIMNSCQFESVGELYMCKLCTIEIFWNIICCQIISLSTIAKFHNVLGCGFMIQWVILIFIKCFSSNQNQLFYVKVWYLWIFIFLVH